MRRRGLRPGMANGWFGGAVKGLRDPGRGPAGPAWLEKLEERVLLSVVAKPVDVGMGDSPVAVIAADLDRDGVLDLVTANAAGDSVSVRLGNGDGTFGGKTDYTVGDAPTSVIAADLDGDGDLDLVTANRDSDNVSVLFNTAGTGTFGGRTDYAMGDAPVSVIVADLDRDGDLDLVTANRDSDNVSVLFNTGTGTFGGKTDYAMGDAPVSVIAADLSNDGKLDLVTANNGAGTISVRLGTGTGTFGGSTVYVTGSAPTSVIAADLNHDGNLDIVTAGSLSVRLGNGDGTLGARTDYTTGLAPSAVIAADMDADGNLDLVTANYAANTVSIRQGKSGGTFLRSAKKGYKTGRGPRSVIAADLNGDGKLDLVTANELTDSVSILIGKGGGSAKLQKFKKRAAFATGDLPNSVIAADLNRDGKLDLVTANSAGNSISVLRGNGDKTFGTNTNYPVGTGPSQVIAADVNRDGILDLVTANTGSNNVSVGIGAIVDGTFILGAPTNYVTGAGPASVAAADLNGDGKLDLVVANSTDDTITLLRGEGNGTFTYVSIGSLGAITGGAGYVNGTYLDRFLTGGSGTGATANIVVSGNAVTSVTMVNRGFGYKVGDVLSAATADLGGAGGGFSVPVTTLARVDVAVGAQPSAIAVADLNRDGKLDVVTTNSDSTANSVSVVRNDGNWAFTRLADTATSGRPSSLVIADLNRDGNLDLAVSGHTTSYNNVDFVSVHLGDGYGTFDPRVDYNAGDEGIAALFAADVNRDGRPDLLTANNRVDSVSVLLGTSTASFWNRTDFGAGVDLRSAIAADLNNDGWLELVTANGFVNTVTVLSWGK